ncbi:hypothetical protein QBC34DRAFT_78872 [Podospora aff. communis PSN243]|uniref:Glucan 1, 4-alpha-glucosidase n=1 Tax=Podospora aff. communis PSN243 TaxID=3040156 RepID=A0AAV9GR08_9PEZI|nr:hypothetical protein QBC34DRAFT_78872 [Podospora aff. communis PSN243]
MDDPWGSPWATTDTEKEAKPPSPAKSSRSGLEPPPRAFFSASGSPRIPAISAQSPWADEDDGFGDWTAPGTPDTTQASGWGGGWVAPSPKLSTPAREDDFGIAAPIAWPGSIALPKTASVPSLRQPSPDPWSADFSPSIDGISTPRLVIDNPPSPVVEVRNTVERQELKWGLEDEHRTANGHLDTQEVRRVVDDEEKHSTPVENGAHDGPPGDDEVRPSEESTNHNHESPFSSHSGDDTDQEDDRQDSPITSIDEDAKTRHQVVRKVSGKVQELVVKFDGLARAASEEPPVIKPERSRSPFCVRDNDTADDTAEFGDFEDGDDAEVLDVPATERPPTPEQLEAPKLPETPETPKTTSRSAASTTTASPESTRDSIRPSPAARDAVTFDIDLDQVGKLFDKLEGSPTGDTGGVSSDIPDCILSDNFTEISERKAWYRISRMGSLRRYNAGDDENYRLVTWPGSTVRDDTIKIVRRWMEEDSIAGRVTLGGGVSKTQKNMFGWDSSVEPVALDTIFGRKKHTRGSSVQSLHETQRKTSGTSYRPSSVIVPPVATFGWSSNTPTFPKAQSPGIMPPTRTNTMPSQPTVPPPQALKAVETPAGTIAPPAAPPAQAVLPLATAPVQQPIAQDDDDDDWGEMVSSPSESKPAGDTLLSLDAAFSVSSPVTAAPAKPIEPTPFIPMDSLPPPSSDPWAVADFSVFESPTGAPPQQSAGLTPMFTASLVPASTPPALISNTMPEFQPASSDLFSSLKPPAPTPTKQRAVDPAFSPTTPLEIASPIALPSANDEPEDDAVRHIIANLPDLSYMFR